MTIEEARKELDEIEAMDLPTMATKLSLGVLAAMLWSLIRIVRVIFDHLDGRGVLSGEPWKGMRFQESAEEIKKENGQ